MNYSQHMADIAAQKLLDAGAPNYVGEVYTITVGEEEQFEVLVTTQKVGLRLRCNSTRRRSNCWS